jgi:hypothetical protein
LNQPDQRKALLREGLKDVGKVMVVAFFVDVIYQIVVLNWYYPVQALIVAFVLAAVPYILIRGPIARIVRLKAAPGREKRAKLA